MSEVADMDFDETLFEAFFKVQFIVQFKVRLLGLPPKIHFRSLNRSVFGSVRFETNGGR